MTPPDEGRPCDAIPRDEAPARGPGWDAVQAAIAAVHDEVASADETDWPQLLALYEVLRGMSDNPMVALNHAIATAMVHGPTAGLELVAALDRDGRVAGHYRLHAVRGRLLERAGQREEALVHYRAAAEGTASLRSGTTSSPRRRVPWRPQVTRQNARPVRSTAGSPVEPGLITQAASALGPRRAMSRVELAYLPSLTTFSAAGPLAP